MQLNSTAQTQWKTLGISLLTSNNFLIMLKIRGFTYVTCDAYFVLRKTGSLRKPATLLFSGWKKIMEAKYSKNDIQIAFSSKTYLHFLVHPAR